MVYNILHIIGLSPLISHQLRENVTLTILRRFLIFSQNFFSNIQETKLSYISGYIQNLGKFRTRSISRTRDIFIALPNIYDGTFCKNSYLAHFSVQDPKIKKNVPRENLNFEMEKWNFLTLILRNFLYFFKRKPSLYFRKQNPRKNFLYFLKRKRRRKPRNSFLYHFWEQ